MDKTVHKLLVSVPVVLLFLLFFIAFPQTASAAAATDIKYSPLFEASLQNTIREFAEKESGEYFARANDAVTEKADDADVGDTTANPNMQVAAYGVPGVPSIPSIPSIPSYTSSYSCGATCGSTCGSTCNATCSSTCGSTCTYTCKSTCSSTCAGSSTCVGTSTCAGSSTCAGTSTCAGSSTCVGMSSCAGSSTCFGTNTCSGTSTCSAGGCDNSPGGGSSGGGSTENPPASDPLPETPAPVNDGTKPAGWAEAQVKEAIESGFVPADLQKNYQSNITRKEFCTLSVQFLKQILSVIPELDDILDFDPGESPFTDVDDVSVTWAYYLKIVNGVGDGRFNPDGQITRQEAATMLTNMAENVFDLDAVVKSSNFSDAGQIASWAKSSVDFVSEYGIMSGVGNNTFAPLGPYTREQSIVTTLRLFNVLLEE